MNTIDDMIELCRKHSAHALEQCMWYIEALEEGDEDAPILGGNPDLVAALGYQTADSFLSQESKK